MCIGVLPHSEDVTVDSGHVVLPQPKIAEEVGVLQAERVLTSIGTEGPNTGDAYVFKVPGQGDTGEEIVEVQHMSVEMTKMVGTEVVDDTVCKPMFHRALHFACICLHTPACCTHRHSNCNQEPRSWYHA